jgi:asparagine synthase (glutamine-hydrolysing)
VTVLLDGQGADETWAGYEKYVRLQLTEDLLHGRVAAARRLATEWRGVRDVHLQPDIALFAAITGGPVARRLLEPLRRRFATTWLRPGYVRASLHGDPLEGLVARRHGDTARRAATADLTRITLPRLLRYADRDSMAWSREVRLPFLDHRLVELAARTPFNRKVVGGWTKEPVRRMLEALGLPNVARRRDKRAYMPPTARWLADPRVKASVSDAWEGLYIAGLLERPEPVDAVIPRWRVLAVSSWAGQFGVSLA